MTRWQLGTNSPLALQLAADARLSQTDYFDDQVWELALGTPGNPLSISASPLNPVGSASIAMAQASVAATASMIVAQRAGAAGTGRVAVTLYNAGAATVYLGASTGVTTSNGMPLPAGASITLDTTAAIYGVAASGTQTLGVTETY